MAPLREVALLAQQGDAEGLRDCLSRLDPPLELGPRASRSDMDFVVAVRLALRRQHEARAKGRAEEQQRLSEQAAEELVRTARRRRGLLHLDPALLLGPLLSDQRRRHLTFMVGQVPVSVRRATLARARVVLRPMAGVSAALDEVALHLRWHGGRGGLDLRCPYLCPAELRDSLMVVFPEPRQDRPEKAADGPVDAFSPPTLPSTPPAPERRSERPSGAWLGEVLAELGFGL